MTKKIDSIKISICIFNLQDTLLSLLLGSNSASANNEVIGDESPSRMRTRNKQPKEQPSSKRPKRGAETPEITNDAPIKTPNKTEKRKNAKSETPAKGKKRSNVDLDNDSYTLEDKEKRKRTDVSDD